MRHGDESMSVHGFDIVERGSGEPLVVVPGVQGRWEYSRALVEALARDYRVITFSLDETTHLPADGALGMDRYAAQVVAALDQRGIERAPVVGVSFGGLVALRVAATRPERTSALVMFSAPGPRWHLRPRHEFYARVPWLFGPLFLAESPFRLRKEVKAALPTWRERRAYLRGQLRAITSGRVSLAGMATRGRLIGRYDRVADCARVTCPTLIVQGDERLDHVTGSGGTSDYQALITGARLETVTNTGHLGTVTKADDCAALVRGFLLSTNGHRRESAA